MGCSVEIQTEVKQMVPVASCGAAKETTIGVRIGSAAPASGRVFHQSALLAGGNVAKSAKT